MPTNAPFLYAPVTPVPDVALVTAISNVDLLVFAAGDYMGGVLTFADVGAAVGRPFAIIGASLLDRADSTPTIDLLLWQNSPTVASAANAPFDITAANASTAKYLGTIQFVSGDTLDLTSCKVVDGTALGSAGSPDLPGVCAAASTSIFGTLIARAAYDAVAATDLEVTLLVNRF